MGAGFLRTKRGECKILNFSRESFRHSSDVPSTSEKGQLALVSHSLKNLNFHRNSDSNIDSSIQHGSSTTQHCAWQGSHGDSEFIYVRFRALRLSRRPSLRTDIWHTLVTTGKRRNYLMVVLREKGRMVISSGRVRNANAPWECRPHTVGRSLQECGCQVYVMLIKESEECDVKICRQIKHMMCCWLLHNSTDFSKRWITVWFWTLKLRKTDIISTL